MWLDLLVVAVLVLFAGFGAWRGALVSGLSLFSLLGAYAAAVWGGPLLAPMFGEGSLLALPVAASAAFLGAYIALSLISALLRRIFAGDGEHSARDRFLGACFGGVRGLLIALLLSYLAIWLDALRESGTATGLPELGDSNAAAITGEVVESGIEAALGEGAPGAKVAARLAAQPAVAIGELQGVLEHRAIFSLREDATFWNQVEQGEVSRAMARPSYVGLRRDAELRRQLAALGLVPPEGADDAMAFDAAVADVLHQVGPRLRDLRNDPALHELMQDPEIAAMAQNGDTAGLLMHPDFRALVQRVIARPATE